MRRMNWTAVVALGTAAACGDGGLEDTRHATGSTTVLANQSYDALYVTNVDQGTVTKVRASDMAVVNELQVGMEPTRLARLGSRVLVTLRGERRLAVLNDGDSGLSLDRLVDLGAEPFGVVAREDGKRVYVSLSTANEVVELDGELNVRRRWSVGGEPRWLALHPSGDALYAGAAFGGFFTYIDLSSDDTSVAMALPGVSMPAPAQGMMFFEDVAPNDAPDVQLTPRLTGDPAVSPAGDMLYFPALYVDNTTPAPPPGEDEIVADSCGYDCTGGGSRGGRFNPILVQVPVDSEGEPAPENAEPVDVAATDPTTFDTVRSYPSSVSVAPEGGSVMVTFEASNVAAMVRVATADDYSAFSSVTVGGKAELVEDGIAAAHLVHNSTGAGPRGVAFLDEARAFVHTFLDEQLEVVDVPAANEVLDRDSNDDDGGDVMTPMPMPMEETTGGQFATGLRTITRTKVTSPILTADIIAGRRLFYAARDSRMSSANSGVSCSTCHLDGRNDGITWHFTNNDGRQTPSLAGQISATAPFTWSDGVATVADEVLITSQGRMGGSGLERDEAERIASFIDYIRAADVPLRGVEDSEIALGRDLFARADVGCAECHAGSRFTDNRHHTLGDLGRTQTPTLVGIAASAPYFHDGSSMSLRDVLERSRTGLMGNTSMLTELEMRALEKYLKSL